LENPPDICRTSIYHKNLGEPKHIVINRTENKSFENVSTLLIKKPLILHAEEKWSHAKKNRIGLLIG